MTQWEYRNIKIQTWTQGVEEVVIWFDGKKVGNIPFFGKPSGKPLADYYNELGQEGWELVNLDIERDTHSSDYSATFKRAKR
ncbi:MAG: hypothetical protein R2932_55540 [Caldilineaceae bacterium]